MSDILLWLNKLNLGDDLLTYVGDHYFKHLLLVKLMDGSGVDINNVKSCKLNVASDQLEVSMKLKTTVDTNEVQEVISDNLNEFSYSLIVRPKNISVTIISGNEEGEMYSNANVINSYA